MRKVWAFLFRGYLGFLSLKALWKKIGKKLGTLTPKGVFIRLHIGLSDLSPN